MPLSPRSVLRAGLLTLTLTLGAGVASFAQTKDGTLGGTWKYSAEKSAAEREGKPRDPTVSRGLFRDPSLGSPTGVRVSDSDADLGPLALYARPLPEVVIVQTDSTVSISDQAGQARVYRLDGSKESVPVIGADPIEITARLRGGKLTTERKFGKMGSIREVYSLRDEGNEMLIEVRITTPSLMEPKTQSRVYSLTPKS